jgi:hypothetical protein
MIVAAVEDATRPVDLGCLARVISASDHRVEPAAGALHVQQAGLFYFHNADGERLGALLYKPAGIAPGGKVPVITWVYES